MITILLAAILGQVAAGGSGAPNSNQPVVKRTDGLFHGFLVNPAQVQNSDPIWQRQAKEIYASSAELDGLQNALNAVTLRYPPLRRGPTDSKVVALTFDDGPHPDWTPRLLEVLRQNRVKATFFVIGMMVEKHPELVQAMAKDGHEVENHSFSHVNLTKIPNAQVMVELRSANAVIKAATGKNPRYYRPPGGQFNPATLRVGGHAHMTAVLWTDDPGDYANPGDTVVENRVLRGISDGGIILMHDGSPNGIDVLPSVIRAVRSRGYRFVTVAELDRLSKLAGR
jgi:peptidoglycan/xylan/chitin deacetylase (PgdA/CDA1 family)